MRPAEDAALLLGIVERHLVVLRLGLGDEFPDEEWGFLAQQATEKLLKAVIVAANQAPPTKLLDLIEQLRQVIQGRISS
jgi:HEPN domain-containing protein